MLVSDANFIFIPPSLGKPDPKEPKPENGPDNRRRIVQLGSKDNTCCYAVYNLLRERWKAPNTEDKPERIFERTVSCMRKAISEHERCLPDIANQLNNSAVKNFLSSITKQSIETMRPMIATLDRLAADDGSMAVTVPLADALPKFVEQMQYQNLYEYLKFIKLHQRRDIYQTFFKEIGVDPKDLYMQIKQCDPLFDLFYDENWESIDQLKKTQLLGHLAWNLTAERFGFKVSSWNPHQPFSSFIEELHRHGPLIVGGCFGQLCYTVLPKNFNRPVMGRDVYGWKKTDVRNANPITGHAILLVGAEKVGSRECIYYIDPDDVSDPAHPEKQRIFCMSYERLTDMGSLCDRYGMLRNDLAPKEIGYALYLK